MTLRLQVMRRHGMLVVVTASLIAAAPGSEPAQGDLDKLQGDWKTKSFLIDGGPLPTEKQVPDRLMTIKEDSFSESRGGKVAVRGTLKLDASKSPKWLDATFTEGG